MIVEVIHVELDFTDLEIAGHHLLTEILFYDKDSTIEQQFCYILE